MFILSVHAVFGLLAAIPAASAMAAGQDPAAADGVAAAAAAGGCTDLQLRETMAKCVSDSQPYAACISDLTSISDEHARKCACLAAEPAIGSCFGPCFAQAQSGICETVGGRALEEAQATVMARADPIHNPTNDGTCDKTMAGLLAKECIPEDADLVRCIGDGNSECKCFKVSIYP